MERETHTPILLCFVATKEWWAKPLRWLLRSRYNHLFVLYYSVLWERWKTIDITKYGVQELPAIRSFNRVKEIECWKYHRSLIHGLQASGNLIGSEYDWLGLIANIIRLCIWRIFGLQWRSPLHDMTRFMCFEFGIQLLRLAGITSAFQLEPSVTSPEELRDFLKNNGGFETVKCPVEVVL